MKNCTVCKTRVDEDEGQLNDDGKFICFECAGESPEEADAFCKECGEMMEEGVCTVCGAVAAKGEDEEEEEKTEAE